jgi:pyruvate dehydrogenase E1 component alpha subunit
MASGSSVKSTKRNKTKAAKSASRSKKAAKANGADRPPALGAEERLDLYRQMLLIRRFEERAGQMYGMGLIGGFCHLYIGQEAVVVGMQACVQPEDSVITSYRDHGHMLACGAEPKAIMAELTGRRGGSSGGKGGSMHMFAADRNFYGGNGIVGAQVSIGTGLGFAAKYRQSDGVSLTYFGDGAVNQGQVHESFNMASLWTLPVVYVIENNKYGMGTSIERASATGDLYRIADELKIPGRQVDGMDVEAVKEAGGAAIAHCRAGNGPYILEMLTYRYRGHSMSDPAKYRSKEEVARVRSEQDPISNLHARLMADAQADEETLKRIDTEVRAVAADAAEFAQNSLEPDPAELYTDVLMQA